MHRPPVPKSESRPALPSAPLARHLKVFAITAPPPSSDAARVCHSDFRRPGWLPGHPPARARLPANTLGPAFARWLRSAPSPAPSALTPRPRYHVCLQSEIASNFETPVTGWRGRRRRRWLGKEKGTERRRVWEREPRCCATRIRRRFGRPTERPRGPQVARLALRSAG